MNAKTNHTIQATVTRKVRFAAAHYFWQPELSAEENFQRYGKSSNRSAHGHNYELEVAVSGPVDPTTGMVVNLKDIKAILKAEVIEPLDFNNLNEDVPFFNERFPTLENLAVFVWERVAPALKPYDLTLSWLKISESDDLYVEYFGGNPHPLSVA